MKLFDLHCDTLTACFHANRDLYKNDFQICLERGEDYRPWVQCFAVWIPDTLRGELATQLVFDAAALLQRFCAAYPERLRQCKDRDTLLEIERSGLCGAILTVEGGAALGGEIETVEKFAALGVRAMTLTWNGSCEIGDGCGVSNAKGLTEFGRAALREMKRYGMIPDLSHASDPLFDDVLSCYDGPLLATHSNAREVCAHPRNLTDAQIRELCRRGGLIGLNFCPSFLREDPDTAEAEDLLRHAEHILSLGGEDVLAMGSDFDGTALPHGLTGIESVSNLMERFLRAGYSASLVEKIFYDNARTFWITL